MSKSKPIKGEVVEPNSYKKSNRQSGRGQTVRVVKYGGFTAILLLIVVIGLLAFSLKFAVGVLSSVLQFVIIVAAFGLIGAIIYNSMKGGK
jgi:uncharacterized membrane protein